MRTTADAKEVTEDPCSGGTDEPAGPQESLVRSRRDKEGGKTTAYIPQFHKLFPTVKKTRICSTEKAFANSANTYQQFLCYSSGTRAPLTERRCIFRNLLQKLLVLVGLLFAFLALCTHKHPGNFKKKKKKAIFRPTCTKRTKSMSPCV